jgi:hypothetical protein
LNGDKVDTPEAAQAPQPPRRGVSPVWVGLACVGIAAVAALAIFAARYAADLRDQRITDSAARAALSDRITSLEHDVIESHKQIAEMRQQLQISGQAIDAALAPDSRIIHLAPLGATPNASAVVAESPIKSKAVLIVTGIPQAPAGQVYQLWWIGPHGEPTRASSFTPGPEGSAMATVATPSADAHVVAGEVTLQPSEDKSPGGTIYFRGPTDEH